jgi:uncharacterized repeat protein (TIGR03943 family)
VIRLIDKEVSGECSHNIHECAGCKDTHQHDHSHNHEHDHAHKHEQGGLSLDTLLLRAGVLLVYAVLLARVFLRHEITLYIKKDLVWLTAAAGFFVLLMLISTLMAVYRASSRASGDNGCGGIAFYGLRIPAKEFLFSMVILMPALLGLLFTPQSLDSFAAGRRGISGRAPVAVNKMEPIKSREISLLRLAGGLEQEPERFIGRDFAFVGFVGHDEKLGAERFYLVRFVISCCAADATPLGFEVDYPEAEELKDNQWVKVEGHVIKREDRSDWPYAIKASRVQPIRKPYDPYL